MVNAKVVNAKDRADEKMIVYVGVDRAAALFVLFQDCGHSVHGSDDECEGRKGDVKYVLCSGLNEPGAPVLADHNSVDFCSGSESDV